MNCDCLLQHLFRGLSKLVVLCGLIIILFSSCTAKRNTYFSYRNPWNVGLHVRFAKGPISIKRTDSLHVVLHNNGTNALQAEPFGQDGFVRFVAYPRFYRAKKAFLFPVFNELIKSSLAPGDSIIICSIPIHRLFASDGWKNKKNIALRKAIPYAGRTQHPYITIGAEIIYKGKIISSKPHQLPVGEAVYPTKQYKKADLVLMVDADEWKKKSPNVPIPITCKVKNKTRYDMVFFEHAGSVRFNLYGYGKNRTSNLVLRFKDSYFVQSRKVVIAPGEEKTVFADDLSKLFFKEATSDQLWYWEWNKKKEAVSPLYLADGNHVYETEIWFGVVIDGKEYLSEIKRIRVNYNN